MSNLREILREEYLKEVSRLDLRKLLEMVQDVMSQPLKIVEDDTPDVDAASDQEALDMVLKMIPNIEVSEIGWSDVSTTDDQAEIKGPQRQLLEGYLKNIHGDDFAARIASVSDFYEDGAEMIATQAGEDRTKRIVQAISYLVFYKTLTKVITNFNASSAGFSFESFLAALVDGYQIKANTGTIADYVDRATGEEVPVSLKLYREGGLEVGGSYTDLSNDLTNPQFSGIDGAMRYVICTKTLEGSGLDQQGKIDFYQFDFTIDNVMQILLNSKHPYVIRLPRMIVSALAAGQQVGANELLDLPAADRALSAEELTPLFRQQLAAQIKKLADDDPNSPIAQIDNAHINKIVEDLNWEKNDDIFNKSQGRVRGRETLNKKAVLSWVRNAYEEIPEIHKALQSAIVNANVELVRSQKAAAKKSERNQKLDDMVKNNEFLTPEESARQYGMLGREQKKQALLSSLGYLRTYHFALNQSQSTNSGPPTNTEFVGSIMIGRAMVARVVNSIRDILNEEVTEIFQSLKILSDSLNTFFAGGLEDDTLAKSATDNAKNISSKEILKTK